MAVTVASRSGTLRACAASAAMVMGLTPALAGPEGIYAMTGTNPGDASPYAGEVVVEKTGEAYAVIWRFGESEILGVGVLAPGNILATSYGTGTSHGIAAYALQADGSWSGTWTTMGGTAVGTETWRPQANPTSLRGGGISGPAGASTPEGQGAARR